MRNEKLVRLYTFFLAMFVAFTIRSYLQQVTWFYDGLLAVVFVSLMYYFSADFKFGKFEFILINIGLILHLLGFFGAYALTAKYVAYDNLVHLFNGGIVAYLLFNFVSSYIGRNPISKNIRMFIFLIFAAAVALCITVELTEYAGFVMLGAGDGMFFVGSGDFNSDTIYGNYEDAMDDIVFNVFGAIIGTFAFYKSKFKKLKS